MLITNLKIDDFDYSMPRAISNIMNEHFSDLGPKLINSVPKSKSSYKYYITPTERCFSIKETNTTKVNDLWLLIFRAENVDVI